MEEPDRPRLSDGGSNDELGNVRGRLQGTKWVALLGTGAALLFLGGIALGASGGFTASIGEAFRSAFGGGERELVIPLIQEEKRTSAVMPHDEEKTVSPVCEEDEGEGGAGPVLITEVAWMGSDDRAADEWVELTNTSPSSVAVAGWQFYDRGRKIAFTFPDGAAIPAGGRMLLMREGTSVDAHGAPTAVFRGALNNTNETLTLFDRECETADMVAASPSWPAGDNSSKRTMERDLTTLAWHDSALSGGTPGLPNSSAPVTGGNAVKISVPNEARPIAVVTSAVSRTPPPSPGKDMPVLTEKSLITWCSQDNLSSPTETVLLHEVAWAGTGTGKTTDEWIELRNSSGAPVPLMGWQLLNRSRTIALAFGSSSVLEPHGYFLIERKEDAVPWIQSDALFSGTIKNNDESLRLFDRDCRLVDEVLAEAVWPAGTAAPEYRSAERSSDRSWHTFNWSPINGIYGTPRMVNSEPAPSPSPSTGGGGGSGSAAPSEASPSASTGTVSILISEVMAGSEGNSSDEFVELHNPGDAPAGLTGWCVKKRTSTGSESTLVVAARLEGVSVAPGGYLLLANDSGYRGSVAPDVRWPSSYTLAYASNTVTLYRDCAERADEVSWIELSAGRSLVRDGWETNTFHVADTPSPTNASGGQ